MNTPDGWERTALRDVCLPVATTRPDESPEDEFTYIDISAIDRTRKTIAEPKVMIGRDAPSRARQRVRAGDILVSTVRPNLRNIARVSEQLDGAIASTGFCVLRPAEGVVPDFLFQALLEAGLQKRILKKARGVSYPAVRDEDIFEEEILLPPTAEQRRIIDRFEHLTRQVTGGLRDLDAAELRVNDYVASLYDSALAGDWPTEPLGAMVDAVTSGSRDWTQYYGRGTGVFIMAQNVRMRRLDLSEEFLVDPPADDPARSRSAVKEDDVLVTIVGAGTGTVARVSASLNEHFVCQSVALVRPKPPLNGKFLELFLTAPQGGQRYFAKKIYGQGRPHLSFQDIKATPMPCLDPLEQERRVLRFDQQMRAVDALRGELGRIRKAALALNERIRADALSGELVSHHPQSDEPARTIVERARQHRDAVIAQGAKKRRPTQPRS